MWPFFKKNQQSPALAGSQELKVPEPKRRMKFAKIVDEMGDFSDLAINGCPMKFCLPEPIKEGLDELRAKNGDSFSKMLRQFFAEHCYGTYAVHVMLDKHPNLFKDLPSPLFSKTVAEPPPGKKRIDTYWVPELGNNTCSMKVWVALRLRNDLKILASHANLTLSEYVREIVISRLFGHGTLPYRPEMLRSHQLLAEQDWCEDRAVEMRQVEKDNIHWEDVGECRSEFVDG